MPAGYAHYVFGEKVLDVLDEKHKKLIQENIDLYNIGIHGPDTLFYYNALKSNPVIKQGQAMHKEEAYVFFSHAKKVLDTADNKDAALAYIYGFINHFVLDHVCHGYVYHMQDKLNMSHYEIESEFDRKWLVLKGLDPTSTCLTSYIHVNDQICEVIAPFFKREPQVIKKSLKDLKFYLNILVAPTKFKRGLLHTVMKLAGIYESHSPLMISVSPNPKSVDDINVLVNKLEEGVAISKRLIEEFLDHELDDIYHNDFEGVKI